MWLNIIQIVSGILLGIVILLQRQGAGLSGAFGGESEFYHTRRGIEKYLFSATIILSILFFVTALINIRF